MLFRSGNICAEFASNGNIKARYLRGANLISQEIGGNSFYYLFNAHGDAIQQIDQNGDATPKYKYDAFGNDIRTTQSGGSVSTDSNPFRYAGEYFDLSSGTYYLRARHYSPQTGRFTSPDTHWNPSNMIYGDNPEKWNERAAQGKGKDALGLNQYTYKPDIQAIMQSNNLYVYCINNPIMFYDPSGNDIIQEAIQKGIDFMNQVYQTYPGFVKNTQSFITNHGKRIPDFINDKVLGEIKAVQYQYNSSQLKGLMQAARDQSKQFVLIIKEGTKLSAPLIAALAKAKAIIITIANSASGIFAPFVIGLEDQMRYLQFMEEYGDYIVAPE